MTAVNVGDMCCLYLCLQSWQWGSRLFYWLLLPSVCQTFLVFLLVEQLELFYWRKRQFCLHLQLLNVMCYLKNKCISRTPHLQKVLLKLPETFTTKKCFEPAGGTLGIFGWGCATGTLKSLAYTRVSSAEFCYPILD